MLVTGSGGRNFGVRLGQGGSFVGSPCREIGGGH